MPRYICENRVLVTFFFVSLHFKAFHIMMIADILNAMRPHTDFRETKKKKQKKWYKMKSIK